MRCISWLDSSCVLVGCLDGKIHQWRIGQQVNVSCFVVVIAVVIAVVVLVMMVVYVCLLPVSKHPFFFIFHTSTSTVVLCC